MPISNAVRIEKTISDPNAEYESLKPLWNRCRAVCSGEKYVKDFDNKIDVNRFTNMLIPFSPSMTQAQYNFYKAEAELPGITAQFSKMIVGGLLRKMPTIEIPENVPADTMDWIVENFGKDDSPLVAFLDEALWEEIQTSRAWVYVDYPKIQNYEELTREDIRDVKPYPNIWSAESVINWRVGVDSQGKSTLNRVVYRGYVEDYEKNEFHPTLTDTIWVHELDDSGFYRIRVFREESVTSEAATINGRIIEPNKTKMFKEIEVIENIIVNGDRLDFLPIWPLNGSVPAEEPVLSPIIDKELALYNKMSRRNHLLYGAATYTPVVSSNMSEEKFENIVNAGLGSWILLDSVEDKITVLETPTEALQDMDRAIAAAVEEIAKLGIRMLSPEAAQSGIALEIRNASQTAQLGTLSLKISNVMKQVIAFMINWRFNLEIKPSEITFVLSEDFSPVPIGADWLRLATEWYKEGLIPRSAWLELIKQNDMVAPDYNDEEGQLEINADEIIAPRGSEDYANTLEG